MYKKTILIGLFVGVASLFLVSCWQNKTDSQDLTSSWQDQTMNQEQNTPPDNNMGDEQDRPSNIYSPENSWADSGSGGMMPPPSGSGSAMRDGRWPRSWSGKMMPPPSGSGGMTPPPNQQETQSGNESDSNN